MRQTKIIASVGVLAIAMLMAIASTCSAETLYSINCDSADYGLWAHQEFDGGPITDLLVLGTQTAYRVGYGGDRGTNLFLMFELPTLSAGEVISSAELSFEVASITDTPASDVDLWGTGFQSDTTAMEEYYQYDGTNDGYAGNVKLQNNILLTPGTTGIHTTDSAGSAAVGAYVNSFYTDNPGYAGGSYVFLRLNTDVGRRQWTSAGHNVNSPSNVTLTLTAVPEPGTLMLLGSAVMCGLGVTLRRRRRVTK